MIEKHLKNEDEQVDFGKELAKFVKTKVLIFLEGDLGAGKTTLTRGFLRSLGHVGNVKSPTYTLIEPYTVKNKNIYHIDLYRVSDINELEFLGIRDILAEESIVIIEWPEIAKDWLPKPDLRIKIKKENNGRSIILSSTTDEGKNILKLVGKKV